MKNAMFQYATSQRILADTSLITESEAKELFDKNRQDFIERLQNNEDPEMCIWINCDSNSDYKESRIHWIADDFAVIDGQLYLKM